MSNEKPVKKFYDDKYWQENGGSGQQLWSMRKLLTFIMEISNPDTPTPFLTVQMKTDKEDDANNWNGWLAEWNEHGGTSLTIEWEQESFVVYSFHKKEDGKFDFKFYYQFGTTDPEDHGWENLNDAVVACREWLLENKELLLKNKTKEEQLLSVFNLS